MTAVKKQILVHVRGPLLERENVLTAHGYVGASRGDFVLTDMQSGDEWPITASIFALTYDVVDPTVDQEKHSAHNISEFEIIKREEVIR